jgi:hypothetical protein
MSVAELMTSEASEASVAERVAPSDSVNADGIYRELACHQVSEQWHGRDVLAFPQEWAERFNVEFKLDVPQVALCIEHLPAHVGGHFRCGHNGFGLKGEIALNARYLSLPAFEVLGILLHEMLHGWQEIHGRPGKGNYHNREFCAKAKSLGLLVDRRGRQGYAPESPFKEFLKGFDVAVPAIERPLPKERANGNSKMKKWSCGCTNVRCAVADLRVQCLKCGQPFQRQEP